MKPAPKTTQPPKSAKPAPSGETVCEVGARAFDPPVSDPVMEIAQAILATMSATSPAPPTVRALHSFQAIRPNGQTWPIGFRDVYSGEQAADLWTRHAEHFEPWPPVRP